MKRTVAVDKRGAEGGYERGGWAAVQGGVVTGEGVSITSGEEESVGVLGEGFVSN